ncbi:MAG: hypothetical protein KY462_07685 [Actinobacteria bacterium]|nr:hypothetical protein [Actinomycetota bacterium]
MERADGSGGRRVVAWSGAGVAVVAILLAYALNLTKSLRDLARTIEHDLDAVRSTTEPLWKVGDTNRRLRAVVEQLHGR